MGKLSAVSNKGAMNLTHVPGPDGSACIRPQGNELRPNQNGPGYSCISCFGTGKKVEAAADPKQPLISKAV